MRNSNDAPPRSSAMPRPSRRTVLQTTLGIAAGAGLAALPAVPATAAEMRRVPRGNISIQLFTLSRAMNVGAAGSPERIAAVGSVFRDLHDIGYVRVEHAGFAGLDVTQFKQLLDDNGLSCSSGHTRLPRPFDASAWAANVEDAATLGSRFLVAPSGPSAVEWPHFVDDLNRAGEIARAAGIRFGYHNHANEFTATVPDGRTIWDTLIGGTDPNLVHIELDVYFPFVQGLDVPELVRSHRSRILQLHVKDTNAAGSQVDVGTGIIDFAAIFAEARRTVEYVVERNRGQDPTPAITTAQVSHDHLSSLRF